MQAGTSSGRQQQTKKAYRTHRERASALAKGLGWFSIGLGLTQLFAPQVLTRRIGLEGRESLMRAYGVRELAAGAGLLSADNKSPWLWGRVGGDALDLATLSLGMEEENPQRANAMLAAVAVGAITALDFYCAQRLDTLTALENAPDFSARSGLPMGVKASRGLARDQAQAMRPRFIDHPPRLARRAMESVS